MNTEELLKERGSVYGDVRDNMNCVRELIQVWDKYSKGYIKFNDEYDRTGYDGCMGMVFHKLARICTGNLNEDNYKDICGYIELARKIAMGTYEEKNAKV